MDKTGRKYTDSGYFDIVYGDNDDLTIERIYVNENKRGNQCFIDIMEEGIKYIKENSRQNKIEICAWPDAHDSIPLDSLISLCESTGFVMESKDDESAFMSLDI